MEIHASLSIPRGGSCPKQDKFQLFLRADSLAEIPGFGGSSRKRANVPGSQGIHASFVSRSFGNETKN
jgi:hypothetical protein